MEARNGNYAYIASSLAFKRSRVDTDDAEDIALGSPARGMRAQVW